MMSLRPIQHLGFGLILLGLGCMAQLPEIGEVEGRCGDGVVGAGEACDDGNELNEDACTSQCEAARCGDSFVRADLEVGDPRYEGCDDGNINDRDACTNACAAARCGDGIWRRDLLFVDDPGFERCDDGNIEENDDCTTACAPPRCGDGIQQDTEVCDDGNESNYDACLNTCAASACGDGFLRTGLEPGAQGYEECDGEADCSDSCQLMFCGNGELEGTEVCDDGNEILTDACANCREARCGDGFVRGDRIPGQPGYEACDDGNLQAGDECSVECLVDDHGNSIQFATVMVAPERQLETYHVGVVRGYMHSLTDRDLFAMTAAQSGVYRFDVLGDEPGRPICTVYNSEGELAGYNQRRVENGNEYRCSIDLYIEANTTAYLEVTTANFIRNPYLYVVNLQMPCGNGVVDEGEECDPEAPNSNSFRCRKDCRNRRMITLAGTTGCAIVNGGVKCWGSNAGLMLGENVENARLCPKLEYGRGRREGNAETDVQVSRFVVDVVDSRHRVADLSGGWNEAVCALYGDSGVTHCWGRHGHITPRCQEGVGCYLSDRLDRCPDQVPTPPGFVGACISSPIEYGITHAQQQPQFTSVSGLTVGSHGSCFIQDTNGGRSAACWGFLYNGMVGYQSPGTCEMAGWSMDECMAYRYLVPMPVSMPNGAEPDFIATGTETSCAVLDSGRVACWGRNDFGQTGSQRAERLGYCVVEACEYEPYLVPVDMGTVIALSVGGDHVCSVNGQGNTFCWGLNDKGQTGLESDDQRCPSNTPCVRRATRLEHLPPMVDVAAGRAHTCALTLAGRVMCWGDNTRGQLGSGSVGPVRPGGADYSRLPVTVGRLGQSLGLTAGEYSNCSRSETGQIYCWGDNAQGQLGDGNCTAAEPSPIQVELR